MVETRVSRKRNPRMLRGPGVETGFWTGAGFCLNFSVIPMANGPVRGKSYRVGPTARCRPLQILRPSYVFCPTTCCGFWVLPTGPLYRKLSWPRPNTSSAELFLAPAPAPALRTRLRVWQQVLRTAGAIGPLPCLLQFSSGCACEGPRRMPRSGASGCAAAVKQTHTIQARRAADTHGTFLFVNRVAAMLRGATPVNSTNVVSFVLPCRVALASNVVACSACAARAVLGCMLSWSARSAPGTANALRASPEVAWHHLARG